MNENTPDRVKLFRDAPKSMQLDLVKRRIRGYSTISNEDRDWFKSRGMTIKIRNTDQLLECQDKQGFTVATYDPDIDALLIGDVYLSYFGLITERELGV